MFGDFNGQIKLRAKQKSKFLSATDAVSVINNPNRQGKIYNFVFYRIWTYLQILP